eukprot:TRINITY_DN10082_c0_g1_i1.p1 TRINITY_DN10082_c0_g1~~TRINITY_DN10082_c0_g1_i1.p1  ORF type:complete len:591 (-),score=101.96 TRINITY_DN10082_c0_g1_i1:22-1794(-)
MAPRPDETLLSEVNPFLVISPSNTKIREVEEVKVKDEKEQILDAIGIWGKWHLQKCLVVLIIIWLPTSFHLLNMVFYRADTDFWCTRPEKFSEWSVDKWKDLSDPDWRNQTEPSKKTCFVKNYDYDQISVDENADFSSLNLPLLDEAELIPCTSWEYDTSFWKKTIIMDFDLVCERYHLRKLQQQMTFLGLMCGVFTAGLISDKFGRRKTMLGLLLLTVLVGTLSSFSPNYPCFLAGNFVCGFSTLGYGTVMYVWMMEHVGGKYKTILGAAPHYNFGFWGLMTAVFAYLIPHWRHLQLLFSAPLIVLVGGFWYLPESARWLLANGRVEEAEKIVREIARVNGRDLPASFRLKPPATKDTGPKQRGSSLGFLQLFMWPNLRKKTLILYYMWFSTALIYYGLTLNSNTLGTDLFTTFSIGKLLEFPSITLVIFLLLKTGRRITLMVFYGLGGVCLTLTMFVPLNYFAHEWPILVLNLLGRISAINTLAVCYIYSAEVFPTVVRNVGLGSSSFWARVGPMIAPFIVDLKVYGDTVPLGVFGVVALLAGLLVTFMPETSTTPLPDTIMDGESIGSGDSFWSSLRKRKSAKTTEI